MAKNLTLTGKKKKKNEFDLQSSVKAITGTVNKVAPKKDNKTVSTTQKPQNNLLNRNSNIKEMPTFKSKDTRTIKTSQQPKKKSIQTYDVYERGGKYFYEENGKEVPIKTKYLKNAIKNNQSGVVGTFNEKGKFSETNSRGVPIKQTKEYREAKQKKQQETINKLNKATDKTLDYLMPWRAVQKKEKEAINLAKETYKSYKKNKNDLKQGKVTKQELKDQAIVGLANSIENSPQYKNLKTTGNALTRMYHGALRNLEGNLDFANAISNSINNPLEQKAKVALGLRTEEEALKERQEAEKQQSEWDARNLTDEGLEKFGWNDELKNKWEHGSSVRRDNTAGQIFEGIGGMVPSILAGKALGIGNVTNASLKGLRGTALLKGIGRNVGTGILSNAGGSAVLGASAYGSGYEEALSQGATPEQARRYGVLNAGTEFATEMVTGGIPGLKQTGILDNMADGLIDKATGKVTNKFLKQATGALLKMGYTGVGEGFEEALADIINPMIKNATYTDGEHINWQDVWRDFFVGGTIGLALGGGNAAIEGVDLANQQIQELNTIADQRIQQIQEEVQQDPSKAQEATQEIQDIQNYVQAQTNIIQNQAKTQAQESETAQPNANTQETQNTLNKAKEIDIKEPEYEGELGPIAQKVDDTLRKIQGKTNGDEYIGIVKQPSINEQVNSQIKQRKEYLNDTLNKLSQNDSFEEKDGRTQNLVTNDEKALEIMNKAIEAINKNATPNHPALTEKQMQEMREYALESAKSNREYIAKKANKNNINEKQESEKKVVKTKQKQNGVEKEGRKFRKMFFSDEKYGNLTDNEIAEYAMLKDEYDHTSSLPKSKIERVKYLNRKGQGLKYPELNNNIKSYDDIKEDYKYIKNFNSENFDESYVNKALDTISANNQGRRTKEQWLDVAKNIGTQAENLDSDSLKKLAFESWAYTNPNKKENLNRQGSKYVQFTANEWIKAVYDGAGVGTKTKQQSAKTKPKVETKKVTKQDIQYGDSDNPQIIVGRLASTAYNKTLENFENQLKYLKEDALKAVEDYGGIEKLWKDSQTMSQVEIANNFGNNTKTLQENIKKEQVSKTTNNENIPAKVDNNVIAEKITNNINNAIKGKDVFEEVEKATGKPIRRGVKTITTATGTTELVSTMDGSIITYEPQANDKTLNKAREAQKDMSLDEKYQDCLDFINSDKRIKAVDIAKIELTLQELQKAGEADKFSNLVQYASTLGTTDAQALQMMSVIKKMNPMTQLETLQKLIQKEQSKGNKIYDGVKINKDLVKKVLDTQKANGEVNQDQFYAAMEELKNDIAKQMKSTKLDKANAFRYIAMLGNPKTHIRNVLGNGFMFGLQSFKDVLGTVGEIAYDTTLKATGKEGMQERTKTFNVASKEVRDFVNNKVDDFFKKNKMKNKYNESMKGLSGDLQSRRDIFSNNNIIGKALNKVSDINNAALDNMDKFFASSMTKKAMKNYLTANGIRTNKQIESNPEIIARALDYALFKGKEATFHQDSTTASMIRNAREKARSGSGYTKAIGLAIDATMPFVSTPVNIAKNAMEYTPIVGFGDLNTQLKNSPKELRGAIVIDNLSKQFAGLSLLGLGIFLAATGKIKGAGDDDKEDKIEKNLGNAQYSIKLGNSTYDLSWISPSAVPLFEGVEIYNKYGKNKKLDVGTMVDTFFGALNPVTDMSVLQSIEKTLTSLAYGKNATQTLGETTLSSYLSQYIPTLSSQFAQWFDTKQRDSNTGSNALGKTFDQIKYKIPATTEFTGVGKWLNKNLTRKSLPEKVNIWGETNKTAENFWQRGFEAFLSPANRKDYKVDSTTKELERVARETGETGALPTEREKSQKIGGEIIQLSGKDYTDFKKAYGKNSKTQVDSLIKTREYKNADDVTKKKMIADIYQYAIYEAKKEYGDKHNIEVSADAQKYALADAFNIPYYKLGGLRISDIKADKNSKGNSISGSAKKKAIDLINKTNLTTTQKAAIISQKWKYKYDSSEFNRIIDSSNLSREDKNKLKEKLKS